MTSRGPFQPKTFYDSMILKDTTAHLGLGPPSLPLSLPLPTTQSLPYVKGYSFLKGIFFLY